MLDIKRIREEPELIKARIRNRGGNASELIDALLKCDEKRRHLETKKQSLQGERNSKSKEIGTKKKAGEDTAEIEIAVKNIGAEQQKKRSPKLFQWRNAGQTG